MSLVVEVAKPDYLSLVNKGGSGYNISELVTSIVAAEIEPKRVLQNEKLSKVDSAISGIGTLFSQASVTKSNFTTISNDRFFEANSSSTSSVTLKTVDETKISNASHTIENIEIARKMVFEISGFSDLTEALSGELRVDFGTWTKSEASSTELTADYAAEKTYIATSSISDGTEISALTQDTSWSGGALSSGDTFTVDAGKSGTLSTSGAVIREVDVYSFSDADTSSYETFTFSGETLTQVAARFNAIDGLNAQIIDTTGDETNYSLVISSTNTGASNGFKITEISSSKSNRWATAEIPSAVTAYTNNYSQLATDARFELDGIAVSRASNQITDVITGAEIELISDLATSASLSFSQSETSIRQTVTDVIFSLNEFKSEIDALTFIDIDGEENGPLAMEASATLLKSDFKKLAVSPILGFGSDGIYLSQLGIKTNISGEFYLDEATFQRALAQHSSYFVALKDDNLSSNDTTATLIKSQFTSIDPGAYTLSNATGSWKLGDIDLTQENLADGGSRFTADAYPGLVIDTIERTPANFDVYIGDSFSQKLIDLMNEVTDLSSSFRSSEDSYKVLSDNIGERLTKLSEREALLEAQYTKRFGDMESNITAFNSTKSLLENLVESWNQK